MTNERKVQGSLVGVNGNAFSLLVHFQQLARRQGFDKEWIDSVLEDAKSADYDHLIYTLSSHMEYEDSEEEEEYDTDEDEWYDEEIEYEGEDDEWSDEGNEWGETVIGDEDYEDDSWVDYIPEDEQGSWRDKD